MMRFDGREQFASFRRSVYSFGGGLGKRRVRLPAIQSADFAEDAGGRLRTGASLGLLAPPDPACHVCRQQQDQRAVATTVLGQTRESGGPLGEETTWHSITF